MIWNGVEWKVHIRICICTIRTHVQFPLTRWKFNNIGQFAPTCLRKSFQICNEKNVYESKTYSTNSINCHLRITRYFGNRWIVKVFVHFLRVWHFAHVGISSPSKTSSFINKSRHDSSLHREEDGNGTLKSQKGSKVTLVLPQVVHRSVLFSWPTNKSRIREFSKRLYHSHVSSAFLLSL